MKQRSASERCNFFYDACNIEGSSRTHAGGLIRLTLAGVVQHALNRHAEMVRGISEAELFARTLAVLSSGFGAEDRDAN